MKAYYASADGPPAVVEHETFDRDHRGVVYFAPTYGRVLFLQPSVVIQSNYFAGRGADGVLLRVGVPIGLSV